MIFLFHITPIFQSIITINTNKSYNIDIVRCKKYIERRYDYENRKVFKVQKGITSYGSYGSDINGGWINKLGKCGRFFGF